MATRNYKTNQIKTQKALERNAKNYSRSVKKDYKLSLDLMRAELLSLIERLGKLDNEKMSKFGRREKLRKRIGEIVNQLLISTKRKSRKLLDGEYKQSYFRNGWAVDQNIGVALKWKLKK